MAVNFSGLDAPIHVTYRMSLAMLGDQPTCNCKAPKLTEKLVMIPWLLSTNQRPNLLPRFCWHVTRAPPPWLCEIFRMPMTSVIAGADF